MHANAPSDFACVMHLVVPEGVTKATSSPNCEVTPSRMAV